ncbi:MAG TPA: TRAP transporter TatT component family protein [Pyrinomonadaceae bacterium]|nr:TRAP transporter TatT component family protein [Pyrinomonadaceae bacterium]
MTLSLAEIIERADALYFAREDQESVRACLPLLQEAPVPLDYEILWRLGRALFFLGQESADRDAARTAHRRALPFCLEAAALEPERVEGHFWLGVNRALLAQLSTLFRAPLLALQASRSLRRAAQIDAAYHAAGPLRVLARLEAHLPFILGGGTTRARAHFEKALSLAPENTVTRIYFAEMLIKTGETHQAQRALQAILNTPPDPAWAFEIARDKKLADEMLKARGQGLGVRG